MRFSHIARRALLGVAGLALGPGAALSATFTPAPAHTPAPAALATILQVDALGFECIREVDIDRAFHMSGKGLRLPQTCLPAPCKAALSKPALGTLIGRAPTLREWDDYYARYAETCRREVVAFAPEAPIETPLPEATGGAEVDPDVDFWTPLAKSYGPDAPIRTQLTRQSPRSAGLPSGGGAGLPGGVTGSLTSAIPSLDSLTASDTTSAEGDDSAQSLPPPTLRLLSSNGSTTVLATPLPATLWLMLAALLGTAGLRRRALRS